MSRVVEMTNTSEVTVQVELENGTLLQVAPNAKVQDARVKNLDGIRKYFKVTEDLSDVGTGPQRGIING